MSDLIKYSVCFRILDDMLDPSEITGMLGITPDRSHRKGDPNTSISKKGKLIHYSPFSKGVWIINSKEDEFAILEHHVKSILLVLYPLKGELTELAKRRYKMDMFCGAFIHDVDQPGFELNPNVLQQLGELNISLGMCIYS